MTATRSRHTCLRHRGRRLLDLPLAAVWLAGVLVTGVGAPVTSAVGDTAVGAPAVGSAAARANHPAPASGVWPLQPRPAVVHGFDPPAERWGSGHRGVDLAGHVGQPVRAALAGRVTFAGRLAGRGVVVVDHGGTRTTYEPVTASVKVGDHVATGGTIGHLALFGSHCFPSACLHWGLIEGRDDYLDPLILVGAAPVILLPAGPPAGPVLSAGRSVAGPGRLAAARPTTTAAGGDPRLTSGEAGPVRPGALTAPLDALGWP